MEERGTFHKRGRKLLGAQQVLNWNLGSCLEAREVELRGLTFSALCSAFQGHYVPEPYSEVMEKKLLSSLFYR